MTIFQAIIYGIVQGLTEFLPISSSAHLIAIPQIFHWTDGGLSFDVALHLGTLVAVVAFFWRDWVKLIYSGFARPKTTEGKLFWYIVVACIPGAIVGKLFEKQAETVFRNLALMGVMLIVMGILLYIADRYGRHNVKLSKMGFGRSFMVGLFQALAIIPGVSRSGITITTGLFEGLTREAAARYSFLLSTPLILGAGLLKIKGITAGNPSTMAVGIITSAIVGFIAIKFLLGYIKKKGFNIFVIYRFIVGALFIILSFVH